jgi:signal transduction histidine kinase
VTAANNSGVWNEEGAALDFAVAAAYYQTNWFLALCAAAFLGLLYALYELRLRQLTREFTMGLEARVSERTRIARELHDTLLQSLHGLMFQFQAVRNLLPLRTEMAIQVLDVAISRTEQAITEGRDAIQDIRSNTVAQSDLPELLTATGSELAGLQKINDNSPTFAMTVEGERKRLSPIIQEEVYQVARELFRNAFRHAEARRIEADIRYDDRVLRLRIRDNGKGIDLKVLQQGGNGHWGLRGARERAERIGAQLDFWSEAGAGTEVQLTVPARIAYAGSRDSLLPKLLRKVTRHAQRN